jgi:hypothetical protein
LVRARRSLEQIFNQLKAPPPGRWVRARTNRPSSRRTRHFELLTQS